jgi:hypothetical protein
MVRVWVGVVVRVSVSKFQNNLGIFLFKNKLGASLSKKLGTSFLINWELSFQRNVELSFLIK